ncbi:hypothetical protein ICN28_04035 [Polynucleobacter sp. 30F-ANTBAC]|jgi:hypothetical protein|uniref:hypothetical protein n=1 Tax=Polynucleobacter sp. 30F-ANTBAC TaxID=2689095 RepID=UPI001C0C06E1|nr:hypothetical protein [Polynucleobacter sp. 30F-ANTBAC]MBU3599683.1 hypothetical protein [Polynucleobacter sp. 30F-ANTBAC]
MKFNSLKYSKKLRLAGFNENQSEILAEGFHEHISYQEVAKKSDLVQLDKKIDVVEIRLEKSIADLGTKLTTFICASSFSVMTILLAFMMFLHSGK